MQTSGAAGLLMSVSLILKGCAFEAVDWWCAVLVVSPTLLWAILGAHTDGAADLPLPWAQHE